MHSSIRTTRRLHVYTVPVIISAITEVEGVSDEKFGVVAVGKQEGSR